MFGNSLNNKAKSVLETVLKFNCNTINRCYSIIRLFPNKVRLSFTCNLTTPIFLHINLCDFEITDGR